MPTRLLPILLLSLATTPAIADPPSVPKPDAPQSAQPTKTTPKQPDAPKDAKPADPTLKLGDKAPNLNTESIKGELVPGIETNKVYIIEFWATWCPSCRETLPKLKKLSKTKDLNIIAIASSEKSPVKDAEDKRLEGVKRFVNDHSDQMPFTVVFDGQRALATDWMVAAHPGLPRYLPFAFIVDSTQTITWFGDPRKAEFDAALDKALKPLAPPPAPVTTADPKRPDKSKPKTTKPKGG